MKYRCKSWTRGAAAGAPFPKCKARDPSSYGSILRAVHFIMMQHLCETTPKAKSHEANQIPSEVVGGTKLEISFMLGLKP